MKKIALVIGLLVACIASQPQTITWDGSSHYLNIAQKLSILEDKHKQFTIQQVSSDPFSKQFVPSKQKILHFGFSQSAYWLRFTLRNRTNDNLVLEVAQAFLPATDLFYQDAAGRWVTVKAGYTVNLNHKTTKHHFQVFHIPKGVTSLYVRLISYTPPIPIKIWNREAFDVKAGRQQLSYGVYIGILLFVIAINLFLFVSFRKFYYLHYAILVFMYLAISAAVMEGFIVYLFPQTNLMRWYNLLPAVNMPVLLSYCISFLQLKKYSAPVYKAGLIACIYFFLYPLWLHLLPLMTVVMLNQAHALIIFILVTGISCVAGIKKNRLGYYFAAAYATWFILVAIEAIYIQTGQPPHIFELSHVSIAIFVELLLLAWLLSKRFEWERKEDHQIRFEAERNLNEMQHRYQEEILKATLAIQENTFTNISEEIHDNIGQILSLAKLNLNTVNWGNQEQAVQKVLDAKDQVARAIVDLRHLSKTLNTNTIQSIGFVRAIEMELQLVQKAGTHTISFEHNEKMGRVDPQKELILFRIFQEAVQNIIKHAHATVIMAKVTYDAGGVCLQIADNGEGFDVSEGSEENSVPDKSGVHAVSSGSGIHNMKSRAALIGAALSIESQNGTLIKIRLPA